MATSPAVAASACQSDQIPEIDLDNYTIFETEHFTVRQIGDYRVPGYLVVLSKPDCTMLTEYSREQTADLIECISRAEEIVHRVIEPERIYVMKFGEVNPRIHFHIFPRTAKIGDAYTSEVDDQKPYCGARLVDWVWKNHESLGFSDEEIQAFVDSARMN